MNRWRALLAAGLMLLLCAGGAAAQTSQTSASADTDAEARHELGRKVYNFRCYFCHGYSGDARTLAATYLSPPPRDFTTAKQLTEPTVLDALRHGRSGTAMKSFKSILDEAEMAAVAAFVLREFVRDRARNTAYHTRENGWPEHQRFAAAFPFATGAIALDADVDALSAEQRRGRALFLSSCISCHDRARVIDEGPVWSARPLSYPRMGFVPGQAPPSEVDAVSGASVYAQHEVAPRIAGLTRQQRRGERLFQANCAFCHGADGSGKNWIGQFMQPKARDLTLYTELTLPAARLRQVIREGLPGTSMPAWGGVLKTAEIEAIGAYVRRALFGRGESGRPRD